MLEPESLTTGITSGLAFIPVVGALVTGVIAVLLALVANGPVNALDFALRKALEPAWPALVGVRLTDYKVRILDGGTEAVTRVLIESGDRSGARWTTIGVSPNIIDASFEALVDSINYKLLRDGAPLPA